MKTRTINGKQFVETTAKLDHVRVIKAYAKELSFANTCGLCPLGEYDGNNRNCTRCYDFKVEVKHVPILLMRGVKFKE